MVDSIQQTTTRPAGENRLALEITIGGGVIHHYEIDSEPYYRALKEILIGAAPTHVVIEPFSHRPSSESEIPSPS